MAGISFLPGNALGVWLVVAGIHFLAAMIQPDKESRGIENGLKAPRPVKMSSRLRTTCPGRRDHHRSWVMISLAAGAILSGIAALLVAVLVWVPSPWNWTLVGVISVGSVSTIIVLTRNPRFFYRRLIWYLVASGLLINGVPSALEMLAKAWDIQFQFSYAGTTTWSFNMAWLGITAILVIADLKSRR
jgi:hypothetical protein